MLVIETFEAETRRSRAFAVVFERTIVVVVAVVVRDTDEAVGTKGLGADTCLGHSSMTTRRRR